MIIPLDQISPDTLESIIEHYILREGTDYGEKEVPFSQKVEQMRNLLATGEAVIVYSELHESVTITLRRDIVRD